MICDHTIRLIICYYPLVMNSEKRINFFGILRDTARKQSASIHLLYKHVKLSPTKGDWDNVLRHQLVQFAAAEILGEWLGFVLYLIINLSFKPDSYDLQEANSDYFSNPEGDLIEDGVWKYNVLEEKIQYYLDDIVAGQNIVPFKERIAEVESRRQDLNEDDELTRKLGGRKYWDAEREVGILIEKELFERLLAQGIDVSAPELIPVTLRIELEKKHGCRS